MLIVTAEVLSPLLDPTDFDTAILFGDAASASILYGEEHFMRARARLLRPDLSAKGDDADALSVPLLHSGFIEMKGRKVFSEAVRGVHLDDFQLAATGFAGAAITNFVGSGST